MTVEVLITFVIGTFFNYTHKVVLYVICIIVRYILYVICLNAVLEVY